MKRKPFPSKVREIKISYSSNLPPVEDRIQIRSSKDAYYVLREHWDEKNIELKEIFQVIYVNRANHILGIYPLSVGSASATVVCIREILAVALKSHASGLILSHNHPSGNTSPSLADKDITSKIKKAAEYMDLNLLDHIILTRDSFYSFSDEGIL